MKVRESDLRHDADPVRFGAAMTRCEWSSPACAEKGECMKGGECFASAPHLVAARMIEALLPKDGRIGLHFAYLRKAALALRQGRIGL